jgi:GT2 family glycosyltransferase
MSAAEQTISIKAVRGEPFRGSFDSLENGRARGWAYNPMSPLSPLPLRVVIDGEDTDIILCASHREDLQRSGHVTGNVGFEFDIPACFHDELPHEIALFYPDGDAVPFYAGGQLHTHRSFQMAPRVFVQGAVDSVADGVVRGWVLHSGTGGALTGQCEVEVTSNGVFVARAIAARYRPDVGNALNADANCGFHIYIPFAFRKPQFREFRCFVQPGNIELGNSPYTIEPRLAQRAAKLRDINLRIEQLHADIVSLRQLAGYAAFEQAWNVGEDYDAWFRRHGAALRARVDMNRAKLGEQPLVSVICPVFRPNITNFIEAVESVLSQTYQNWELIIVNDGSGDAGLADVIARFAAAEPRIRVINRKKNAGISAATNAAIAAAQGAWIALFDHDDLLVSVALELMMNAARDTGATVLYSDEDKITDTGYFLEPAFKPDFNHRFLLGSNFVAHLLIIRADIAAQVGKFDSRFDGAQDHDFILRIAEIVPPKDIHHVPEILYHWRMSAGSTAVSIANKQYAVDAGINCIRAHLARRNLKAEVTAIENTTRYRVIWQRLETPSVAIIIPFREHVDLTQSCVERLLATTSYGNYRIFLIDNGSRSTAASQFVADIARDDRISVIRVDEPFNFSRLCNLGAHAAKADYFVFMNNDIFVESKTWLRRILDESLADPKVAIVGGKFFYPNRTIQHAGVALGIGGVAGHLHTGLAEDNAGYMSRAVLAQELSAVTGAGMLVRADVFREIGGFDEFGLQVDYSDIDLCLKAGAAGYKIIWTPEFIAEHHESISRGSSLRPDQEERFFLERQTMIRRWPELLARDPHYNEKFDLAGTPFFDLAAPGEWPKAARLI